MVNKVLLIGDSYGIERRYFGKVIVPAEKTWPHIVMGSLSTLVKIQSDFISYRKLVDIPKLIEDQYTDSKVVIIQAGIVDIYPRPLPPKSLISQKFMYKNLRRIIRIIGRAWWIRHIYSKSLVSLHEIEACLNKFLEESTIMKIGFVLVSPISEFQSNQTPGAREMIKKLNGCIKSISGMYPNSFVIDIHSEILNRGSERFLDKDDSHFNIEGNSLLAELTIEKMYEEGVI